MKPAPFEYKCPESVDEVLSLLTEYGEDARVLAGGQSLVPMLALRLTHFPQLIDVNRVQGLDCIQLRKDRLVVGATARQTTVAENTLCRQVPLLGQATGLIGHFQIRNRGTVGGSLAHADAAAEYPAVAFVLGAEMMLASQRGVRSLSAAQFFLGDWTTAIRPDELMTEVHFPTRTSRSGFAIKEVARRPGDFALAGVACAIRLSDDTEVADVRVAAFGVASRPVRLTQVETALLGLRTEEIALGAIAPLAAIEDDLQPRSDVHASSEYRREVVVHLTSQTLQTALEEASLDAP